MRHTIRKTLAVAAATPWLLLGSQSAIAQKSKDTLRVPFTWHISTINQYMETGLINRFFDENVHDGLVTFDEQAKKVRPLLAKSWKIVDGRTLEFDLRDDVTWHDGEKFDADDAVIFLNWVSDPKVPLRNKSIWSWIERAEKLGPYKIRLTAKEPAPWHLVRLASETQIYPEHIFQPLKDKKDYGRSTLPVGTGPYKFVSIDRNEGVRLTHNRNYKHGGVGKPQSNIGNLHMRQVPDLQTQIAGMLTGEWDMLVDLGADQAREFAKNPKFELTTSATLGVVFMTLDANGISPTRTLTNQKVRQAIFMGINRKELQALYFGGVQPAFTTDNLCFKFMHGCDFQDGLIRYDPAAAKKLLNEAGFGDGLDIEISTPGNTFAEDLAKVISEQLRQIGIKVTVDGPAFLQYMKKEREGKATIRLSLHSPRVPDTVGTTSYFFPPDDLARNRYFLDDRLAQLARSVDSELDPAKRKALMAELLAYNAEKALVMPLTSSVAFLVHTNEVKVSKAGRFEIYGFYMRDLAWR